MERIKKSVKIGLLPAFAGRIKRKFYGHRSGDQRQRFLWGFECVFEESPPFVRIRILRIDGLAGFGSVAENLGVNHLFQAFPSPAFVIRRRRIFTMNDQPGRCLVSRPYEVSENLIRSRKPATTQAPRIRISRIGGLAGFGPVAENRDVHHVYSHFPSPPFCHPPEGWIFTITDCLHGCLAPSSIPQKGRSPISSSVPPPIIPLHEAAAASRVAAANLPAWLLPGAGGCRPGGART